MIASAGSRLTTNRVQEFLTQTRKAVAAGELDVDLAPYEQVDSAAVAALLALRRDPDGHRILFRNPSENLRKLADLYGVEDLLFRS